MEGQKTENELHVLTIDRGVTKQNNERETSVDIRMHRQNNEIQISTVDLRMEGEDNETPETTIDLRTDGQNNEREMSMLDQQDDQSQTSSTNTGEGGRNDEGVDRVVGLSPLPPPCLSPLTPLSPSSLFGATQASCEKNFPMFPSVPIFSDLPPLSLFPSPLRPHPSSPHPLTSLFPQPHLLPSDPVRPLNDEEVVPTTQILPTRLQRLEQTVKRNHKPLMYTFLIVKELVDSILDWLLYYQLCSIEEGLVVGPVDAGTLGSLLFFCCIGTVLGVLDTSNRLYDLYTGRPFVDVSITETLVLFFEDIPQLMIGIIITICRGKTEAKLAVKLKVVIILVASIITLVLSCIRIIKIYKKYTIVRITFYSIHFFGMFATCLIAYYSLLESISIFANENAYDLFHYNVGIFVDTRHIPFHSGNKTWLQLFDLDDILGHGEITSRITTDPNHLRIQNYYDGMQKNNSDICYRLNGSCDMNVYFTKVTDCSLSNGTAFHYRFKYIPPSKRHPYGDIQYNLRKTNIVSCDYIPLSHDPRLMYFQGNATEHLNNFVRKNESDDNYSYNEIDITCTNNVTVHVLVNETMNTDFDYVKYTFYSAENDLTDIRHVWDTGLSTSLPSKCNTTGSISPHFNPDIPVPCPL